MNLGCHMGSAGILNDINTWTLVTEILQGKMFPDYIFEAGWEKRIGLYSLVDFIYPHWAIFVSTITEPCDQKETQFSSSQEALQKDVEGFFDALLSLWVLLSNTCPFFDREKITKTIQATIILYNIIMDNLRYVYDSELWNLSENSVRNGQLLDYNGKGSKFIWDTWRRTEEGRTSHMSDSLWEIHVSKTYVRIRDYVVICFT